MTTRITVSLPDELADEVNNRLEYGDSRSEWVAEAIRMRLDAEADADEGNRRIVAAPTAD